MALGLCVCVCVCLSVCLSARLMHIFSDPVSLQVKGKYQWLWRDMALIVIIRKDFAIDTFHLLTGKTTGPITVIQSRYFDGTGLYTCLKA